MSTRKSQKKTDAPAVAPGTAAVQRYRARQANAGAATLYCTVSSHAADALKIIMHKQVCSKRTAIEYALKRSASELSRKR